VNNGRCAEADALSKALTKGIPPSSLRVAECQAVVPKSAKLVPPCQSCTQVLRRLGIKFTGDVDFNPVLAQIVARRAQS
jgi:cytidine deaminase